MKRLIRMTKNQFTKKLKLLFVQHQALIARRNKKQPGGNGVLERYEFPVLTADHTPVFWRYDLNYQTNPHLLERFPPHQPETAAQDLRFRLRLLRPVP